MGSGFQYHCIHIKAPASEVESSREIPHLLRFCNRRSIEVLDIKISAVPRYICTEIIEVKVSYLSIAYPSDEVSFIYIDLLRIYLYISIEFQASEIIRKVLHLLCNKGWEHCFKVFISEIGRQATRFDLKISIKKICKMSLYRSYIHLIIAQHKVLELKIIEHTIHFPLQA